MSEQATQDSPFNLAAFPSGAGQAVRRCAPWRNRKSKITNPRFEELKFETRNSKLATPRTEIRKSQIQNPRREGAICT
jgi:hypothetical protein